MIKLISLDLDGTLLDPQGRITESSKKAIAKARAAGVRVVLNTGRPAPEALWFAQEAGLDEVNACLGGAALDVMDPEPLPQDHPLWTAKNLILTPHVSGNMTLGYTCDQNVEMFCRDLENYAAGRPLASLIDRTRGY